MQFELYPILSIMEELYQQPLSPDRFQEYIAKLQGHSKGGLELPIGGFNPMAKEHLLKKIADLKALDAEHLMSSAISQVNARLDHSDSRKIFVVLNLADDLKGGWTNHYTTDFDSKFKINALINRNFCTPYFWSSEPYSESLVKERTLSYLYRTLHWIKKGRRLSTLEDFVAQEIELSQNLNSEVLQLSTDAFLQIDRHFQQYRNTDDYSLIFNFFYGDETSKELNYPTYGMSKNAGFEYVKYQAKAIAQKS